MLEQLEKQKDLLLKQMAVMLENANFQSYDLMANSLQKLQHMIFAEKAHQ